MENVQKSSNELIPPFSLEFAQDLLKIYGSPLYVYEGDRLRDTIEGIGKVFTYKPTKFHFATVTNGNVSLLKIFRDSGWGLHANTPGDIYLGLNAGFKACDIVYSGSNLSSGEMEQVLSWGVTTFNLDSLSQLEVFLAHAETQRRGEELSVGLRLSLPEITGEGRIGVGCEEFEEAINVTDSVGVKLTGLHFYRGTGTNATKAFTDVIDRILSVGKLLPDWQYLDFGGGFGFPYKRGGVAFDWQMFGTELSQRIGNLGYKINLIIEPGRSAIAGCATMLAQVVSIKWQGKKQIVGVDTTVANLSVPSVHGGYREIVTWKNVDNCQVYTTDVCGNTTYSRDYLGKSCQLPALEVGDIIAILDVGAYGYAMSSHFLHRPKPAEVLLENNTHRLIRKREDYSVLLTNQIY
ncbi:decarboxylase [Cronbergia sp. UHCC 0137]|uniref:diaminopimelate decarboxylase family protein n=1 Tax=Cronbergia sp. UHCC 0137 TaxID=3110239 RepID=UPI002B2127EC|nr:decarboxylase [Cronbergia sp. UHCC 0137]MEA5617600.1 decarboxylase [Cronbergia sp. UHCC 0137]